jgi:uncharacterized HhH-GPD family protein
MLLGVRRGPHTNGLSLPNGRSTLLIRKLADEVLVVPFPDAVADRKHAGKSALTHYQRDRMSTMPDRLYFTDSDEANALIAADPMALLIGFALDQQVSVQKAFAGPLALRERIGSLEPEVLAEADLEPIFREKPAIHRFPTNMARRVQALAAHVRDNYDGDAARVWQQAPDAQKLRANLEGLPGFGEMKVKALAAVLANRYGVKVARELVPPHPTLGDVDSPQALLDYQAAKRIHKAEWKKTASAK